MTHILFFMCQKIWPFYKLGVWLGYYHQVEQWASSTVADCPDVAGPLMGCVLEKGRCGIYVWLYKKEAWPIMQLFHATVSFKCEVMISVEVHWIIEGLHAFLWLGLSLSWVVLQVAWCQHTFLVCGSLCQLANTCPLLTWSEVMTRCNLLPGPFHIQADMCK